MSSIMKIAFFILSVSLILNVTEASSWSRRRRTGAPAAKRTEVLLEAIEDLLLMEEEQERTLDQDDVLDFTENKERNEEELREDQLTNVIDFADIIERNEEVLREDQQTRLANDFTDNKDTAILEALRDLLDEHKKA